MKRLLDILLVLLHLAFYAVCYVCFLASIAGLVEWVMAKWVGSAGDYRPDGALLQLAKVLHIPFALVCVMAFIGAGYLAVYFYWASRKNLFDELEEQS